MNGKKRKTSGKNNVYREVAIPTITNLLHKYREIRIKVNSLVIRTSLLLKNIPEG